MPQKTLLALCCSLLYSPAGFTAENVEFDQSFLMGSDAATIDVDKYSDGNPTPPGTYNIKVFVNDKPVTSLSV
ncbi:MAG: FimD/PapC N-terminal domain-containing protein, partial [Pluralibacter gergoviae]|nr:FimD/PapC N-terminal domain-containing protein [Pluralibacter gergoviae]